MGLEIPDSTTKLCVLTVLAEGTMLAEGTALAEGTMRSPGIEPGLWDWKSQILPLNYER